MGDETNIGWADDSRNFWTGCAHARYSDGTPREACGRCYAEAWAKQTGGKTRPPICQWGEDQPRHRTGANTWAGALRANARALKDGRRRNQFTLSLGDFFDRDDRRCDDWRRECLPLMAECRALNWLILTKRVHLAQECLSRAMPATWHGRVPENFWLGITVETQRAFDEQWATMAHVAAMYDFQHLFFSMEPLFEYVDITPALLPMPVVTRRRRVNWVIPGGESGQGCRPTELTDMAAVAEQCERHDVPVFIKQMGTDARVNGARWPHTDRAGARLDEMPPWLARHGQQFPERMFDL